jgi:transposase InsO family protein
VLSDNGSAYRSKPWRLACEALGLSAKRTRPYTPRTNGKAERFIKTLVHEWAYGLSFQSSEERNRWLSRYLAIYNGRRCHMALAGRTPFQQLGLLRATE